MATTGIIKFRCKVPSCKNAYYRKSKTIINKHFFSFPEDPDLRKQWFNAINENSSQKLQYSSSKDIFLCEDHFETRLFTSTLKTKFTVKSLAIPTIFDSDVSENDDV